MLSGIDVSNNNGAINWTSQAAVGTAFAYIKATQSTSFTDPYYAGPTAHNWADSKAAGIIRGAYHYWRPDTSPQAQAQHFFSVYGRWTPGDLPPAVDIELDPGEFPGATPQTLVPHALATLAAVESLCGVTPVLYTYIDFWHTRMGNSTAFTHYPLWLAAYPTLPNPLPGGWQTCTIHQYSGSGIDKNYFSGTLDRLKEFCGLTPPGASSRYFPQTGHYIEFGFRDKWEEYERKGVALEVIGYPIEEPQQRTISTWSGTTQYFERARMEYHPELIGKPTLFGLLGKEALHI